VSNARFPSRALPAHTARLIGFPFWESAASPARAPAHPFALRLGATQLIGALALIGIYYTNIYLGYETLLESPGAVPGTLSSRVGVVGLIIPLPRMLQVSNRLPSLYSCSANVSRWDQAYLGSLYTTFDPSCWGGQNGKNRDCVGSQCAVGSPFHWGQRGSYLVGTLRVF